MGSTEGMNRGRKRHEREKEPVDIGSSKIAKGKNDMGAASAAMFPSINEAEAAPAIGATRRASGAGLLIRS